MTVDTDSRGHAEAGRNGAGQFARTLEGAEKDAEAARLQARGLSLRQIARELGYADQSGAHKAIARALAAVPVQGVDELRRVQCDQLDYLTQKALAVLEGTYFAVSQSGKVVTRTVTSEDGEEREEALYDSAPLLHAIDRIIRIAERRAKLMGLDAPTRHEVTTLDYLDAQIRDASAELARAQAGEAATTPGA